MNESLNHSLNNFFKNTESFINETPLCVALCNSSAVALFGTIWLKLITVFKLQKSNCLHKLPRYYSVDVPLALVTTLNLNR